MDILDALGRHLPSSFGARTLEAGRAIRSDGAVLDLWIDDAHGGTAQGGGLVQGTTAAPYEVGFSLEQSGAAASIDTLCTCPVSFQCKHGAAVALVLAAAREETRAARRTWRDEVDDLSRGLLGTDPGEIRPGVGLEFSTIPEVAAADGAPERIVLRPMRPGARGGWAKSGLGWSEIPLARVRRSYDPDQLAVLERLLDALRGHGHWRDGTDPVLDQFGPHLVPLLRDALAVGVTMLTSAGVPAIRLMDGPVSLGLDLVQAGREAAVTPILRDSHTGRQWTSADALIYGNPASVVTLHDPDGVTIAELRPRLDAEGRRAFARAPITLPASEVPELLTAVTPLRRSIAVLSSDATVPITDAPQATLRGTIRWRDAADADVDWTWRYGLHDAIDLDDDTDSPVRDRVAERAILARMSPAPEAARYRVAGPHALRLARECVPAWTKLEGVEIEQSDPPVLRETDAEPRILFRPATDTAEQTDEGTDWLDLFVVVEVDGEAVPLAAIVEAITLESDHVLLPSGLLLRTDHPVFGRLIEVVRAAAQLHDQRGDRVRVNRDDAGTLAAAADLGEVEGPAREWVARARSLRDLVSLPDVEPAGLTSTLRPYQRDGVRWLTFLCEQGLGGILADDMGLGKTLQVLALIAHARERRAGAPFLVVAPTSVVSNWARESRVHTPGLTVRAVTSTASRRSESLEQLAAGADVVVTSYTLLRLDQEEYTRAPWGGLVFDEAQQLKNHRSKVHTAALELRAPFKLAVTGTPFENRLVELWSLLAIVAPGLYPRERTFRDHVVIPVEKQGDKAALSRLHQRIRPFMLRRTKELVAPDLPPKQEQVITVDLTPAHRRIYETHLNRERQRVLGLVEDFSENQVAVLAALTKLRQLALDPALIDPAHHDVPAAKIDVLADRIAECVAEGHRALVFSSFTGFLTRVRQRLEADGVACAYLDGATRDRAEVIESFHRGEAEAFLISLKAGGTGLTLTEADYVFVLDPWWNPAAEAQAVDRAHRIGQQQTVMVYRLVAADTVEEKVMALKERKARLFAQVVDGEGGLATGLTADDVRELFS
ncbi:DEAD/DEAH box helicase [Nocardioides sp. R-C-SC26]|uniref:DEAD/DEAH box helicase n=1 Tax=Nocardioides sp. R-C-SC26 TaxID=2870414 RepID=UPI001E5648E5|nr:DEAD/DEAH box helicase [Nocardioides sp. R-C-SC26]